MRAHPLLLVAAVLPAVALSQNTSRWTGDYDLNHPLYRAESYVEAGDDYVVTARGGNLRSELTIDRRTGALRAVRELPRGCGTLVYGPVPLGPREVLQFATDASAGRLTVRRLALGDGCAIETVRWERVYDLPPGTGYDFDAGAASADGGAYVIAGVIETDGRGRGRPYRPALLSVDAADGALRYAYVGAPETTATATGQLGAPLALRDGGAAAVLFGDAGRAHRLYWVDADGRPRFPPAAPADTTASFRALTELPDGSVAAFTTDASARRAPGAEAFAEDGARVFATDYGEVLADALGPTGRPLSYRAAVHRASGEFVVALRATDGDDVGLALVQAAPTGAVTGVQFAPLPLVDDLLTTANRLYEDRDGALLFFGEAGEGMLGLRTLGNFVSDLRRPRAPAPDWTAAPNPATDRVAVLGHGVEGRVFRLRNGLGQVMRAGTLDGGGLSVAGLSTGAYVLEVEGRGRRRLLVR